LFGAILGECITWMGALQVTQANKTEKFLKKFLFENITSYPEEEKKHFEFSRNQSST